MIERIRSRTFHMFMFVFLSCKIEIWERARFVENVQRISGEDSISLNFNFIMDNREILESIVKIKPPIWKT